MQALTWSFKHKLIPLNSRTWIDKNIIEQEAQITFASKEDEFAYDRVKHNPAIDKTIVIVTAEDRALTRKTEDGTYPKVQLR